MSYDLAVWDGEQHLPEDGALTYINLSEEYLEADPTPPRWPPAFTGLGGVQQPGGNPEELLRLLGRTA